MTQNPMLTALSWAGVSVWLDDLSRDLLRSGKLQQLIDTRRVVGVTTNPSTFERALRQGGAYDEQIAELTARGATIVRPPEDQVYGCRDFEVRDLDGYVICFGQDIPNPTA